MDEVTLPPLPTVNAAFSEYLRLNPEGRQRLRDHIGYDEAEWLAFEQVVSAYAQQAASAAVLQERARAEQDAMRYRWLRDAARWGNAAEFSVARQNRRPYCHSFDNFEHTPFKSHAEVLDAAIDAAIREGA